MIIVKHIPSSKYGVILERTEKGAKIEFLALLLMGGDRKKLAKSQVKREFISKFATVNSDHIKGLVVSLYENVANKYPIK